MNMKQMWTICGDMWLVICLHFGHTWNLEAARGGGAIAGQRDERNAARFPWQVELHNPYRNPVPPISWWWFVHAFTTTFFEKNVFVWGIDWQWPPLIVSPHRIKHDFTIIPATSQYFLKSYLTLIPRFIASHTHSTSSHLTWSHPAWSHITQSHLSRSYLKLSHLTHTLTPRYLTPHHLTSHGFIQHYLNSQYALFHGTVSCPRLDSVTAHDLHNPAVHPGRGRAEKKVLTEQVA